MGLPAVSVKFELFCQTCINCGIVFGVPEDWDARRRKDHAMMYCPNGHQQHYTGKTEEQKLKEEVDRLKRSLEWERAQVRVKEKEVAAQKGLVTKTKRKLSRVTNGVCPECNRHFVNVERHMKSKHTTK